MARLLGALLVLALGAVFALLPDPHPIELAAMDGHRLLGLPAQAAPLAGSPSPESEGAEATMMARLLSSSAVTWEGPEHATLRLGGVLITTPIPSESRWTSENDPLVLPAEQRLLIRPGRAVRVEEVRGSWPAAGGAGPVTRLRPVLAGETDLLACHGVARRSIVRGLREQAAAAGITLDVEGELAPRGQGGLSCLIQVDRAGMALECSTAAGESFTAANDGWRAPRRTSLVPPLVAILLAILIRRPVISLFAGVWAATFLMRRAAGDGISLSIARGLPDVATELFWPKFVDLEYAMIIGFVVAMLSMVGVMTRSGGIRGLMNLVARLASSARSTQLSAYLMGLAIFFDDYANTILVGSTMRPLTDRFRIAREKLAYIVDSTAAPVAGISIFSTWIAFEVSTFSPQLPAAGLLTSDGYAVFIETLPYRFYCLLTLCLVPILVLSRLDFGPMLAAERRARRTGALVRAGGKPMVGEVATRLQASEKVRPAAHRALLPLAVFLGLTLFEICRVGMAGIRAQSPESTWGGILTPEGLTWLLREGGGPWPILVGSSSGLAVAALLALLAGLRGEILSAAWSTLRSMGVAIAILYLAWMIGLACEELGTASFLTVLLGDRVPPGLLPAILFLMSAAVAFSTGSSWSTMSILLPLVVGLSFTLGETTALGGHLLMVIAIGSVLEGSIFGDHCSPISDTTVLSSTACASDHIDHVRTQAPYALVTMLISLGTGYIPCALLGWSPWVGLLLGIALLVLVLRLFGRRVEEAPDALPAGGD